MGHRRPFTLAEPTASGHNRGIGSANVKRALLTRVLSKFADVCGVGKDNSRLLTHLRLRGRELQTKILKTDLEIGKNDQGEYCMPVVDRFRCRMLYTLGT